MDLEYRFCCGAPDAVLALSETQMEQPLWNGPTVDVPPPQTIPRNVELAEHESGHAVVAHGFGLTIEKVRIDPVGMHSLVEASANLATGIAISVAGPLIDALRGGWRARTGTLDFEIVSRRVLACWAGQCDHCKAVRAAVVIAGSDQRASAFRILRRIERQVVAFLGKPEVDAAVNDLAAALMSAGTVSGEQAHAILSRHVLPGSFTLTMKELENARPYS
ncbi:MAG: hypothetical protein J0I79_19915 [Mesorhizobium sp.]|uniref:hypothetical protein n=1 Tax=Mesorhizobium sp. TaxID=1871066 RepID=UPI001ACB70EA|nr:hypothetical protein [Mesorhizobium sp.]MBN9220217.1 hypothetical protein [Mesorhizobium sp.]